MALDEAVLETLGLAPLWVRRGSSETVTAHADAPLQDGTSAAGASNAAHAARIFEQSGAAADGAHTPSSSKPASLDTGGRKEDADSTDARRVAVARDAVLPDVAADVPSSTHIDVDRALTSAPAAAIEPAPPSNVDRAQSVEALDWAALEARVAACEHCRLCEKRTKTVFGVGDREADWMLIGEAPGENEDKQGEPFVGQAGKLLDGMLHALGLARGNNVYIANVVKCRPPGNRNPEPDEAASCEPYLQRQVALVKPKLIVALGRVAAQNLLKTDASISSLRGRVHRYEDVPVVVTYHPAYLLRSLPDKAKAWVDLCLAREAYRQSLAQRAGQ